MRKVMIILAMVVCLVSGLAIGTMHDKSTTTVCEVKGELYDINEITLK